MTSRNKTDSFFLSHCICATESRTACPKDIRGNVMFIYNTIDISQIAFH